MTDRSRTARPADARRVRRWAAVSGVVATCSITAFAAAESASVRAAPVIEYLGEEYDLQINNPIAQLCVGENSTLYTVLKQYGVYRQLDTSVRAPRPRAYRVDRGGSDVGGAVLTTEVGNQHVVTVAPSFQRLADELTTVYAITANDVGTTDVNFAAAGPGVVPAGATMTVQVTECDYEVHTFSIWHINAGRNVVMASSIDTVIHGTGVFALQRNWEDIHATIKNDAVSFDPPCQAAYHLPDGDGEIWGNLIDDVLSVKVYFEPLTVRTAVRCSVVSGGATDPESVDDITFTMHGGGGQDVASHVLHAPGLGDFTGTTYITVIPIRP